jgi:hypothetical protein
MVHFSATRYSYIAILWVSLVSSDANTLCVAPQRVFIVVSIYFVIDSVRKLLNAPSYKYMSIRERECVCVCVRERVQIRLLVTSLRKVMCIFFVHYALFVFKI